MTENANEKRFGKGDYEGNAEERMRKRGSENREERVLSIRERISADCVEVKKMSPREASAS